MLNIIELESRWLKYKIKSYLPHFVIVVSILVIAILAFTFAKKLSPKDNEPKSTTITSLPVKKTEKEKETFIEPKPLIHNSISEVKVLQKRPISKEATVKNSTEKSLKLSPSLDFMKKMQNSVQPYYVNEHPTSNDIAVSTPKVETVPKEKVIVKEQSVENVNIEPHKISIKHQNTQHDIQDIIKRFKKNENPALSLFVAKKYYEIGNYNEAYNYALITNSINKDIDVSWIIFTKSLVKLGQKNKAIKVLQKYISQSHSSRAEILLDEIRSGKFK
jgi:tetratricopeptide (TPR) repeat protein